MKVLFNFASFPMFLPNYLASFGHGPLRCFRNGRAYKILSASDNDLYFNVGESPPSLFRYA